MLAHGLALAHAGPPRREDRGRHALAWLVGESHVVELHFPKTHAGGFLRELRGVDPHRIVVGVHPRDVDPIAPQPAGVTIPYRPRRLSPPPQARPGGPHA